MFSSRAHYTFDRVYYPNTYFEIQTWAYGYQCFCKSSLIAKLYVYQNVRGGGPHEKKDSAYYILSTNNSKWIPQQRDLTIVQSLVVGTVVVNTGWDRPMYHEHCTLPHANYMILCKCTNISQLALSSV